MTAFDPKRRSRHLKYAPRLKRVVPRQLIHYYQWIITALVSQKLRFMLVAAHDATIKYCNCCMRVVIGWCLKGGITSGA